MSESSVSSRLLAAELRRLRVEGFVDGQVTQRQLADILKISPGLLSSWENAKEIPPEDRVRSYARFFCTPRTLAEGRLLPDGQLDADEEAERRRLIDVLVDLRDAALQGGIAASAETGQLGGRFWHFPDGLPVVIAYNALGSLAALDYANPDNPNYIQWLSNGDIDATMELFGHVRAENPRTEVRVVPQVHLQADMITGSHLVILGGAAEENRALGWFWRRLDLPVRGRVPADGDEYYDTEFVVSTDADGEPQYDGPDEEGYQPIFLRDKNGHRSLSLPDGDGRQFPLLEYDLALFARQRNPLNQATTVTVCSGIFSRGSYGAVRTCTDASLRGSNEKFLYERYRDPARRSSLRPFWMLIHVPVLGAQTITPDLTRAFHRVRASD
jgi:transcriptional regulator with XRE-family HTH domain